VISASILSLAAVPAVAEVLLQPTRGVTDEYRIRMSTYSGENQMPLLIIALQYRDTALEDGRRQLDIVSAERYQPFAGIWLPSIIDSVDPSQDDLPDDVQLRVIVDRQSPLMEMVPDDIPDVAFGMITELIQIVRAQMDVRGVGELEAVGDSAAISPFFMQWKRARTDARYGRSCSGGTARLDSVDQGIATVRWSPETLRWTILQIGSPNQLVTAEEEQESLLRIDAETGALISSTTTQDRIRTEIIGPVDFASIPDWDEIVRPPDAAVHITNRFIEVKRLKDYLLEEQQRQEGENAPAGPPVPQGSGD
jgi:hypothetical protein